MDPNHFHRLTADATRDIEAVVVGFCMALDRSDYDAVLDFVTDDIEWVRPSGTVCGRAEVRQALEARPKSRITRHLVTNIGLVPNSAGMVTARSDLIIFEKTFDGEIRLPAAASGPSMVLGVEDVLVREANGSLWRIARKLTTVVFSMKGSVSSAANRVVE